MARTMKNTTMETPSSTGMIWRNLRPMYSARAYNLLKREAAPYAPPESETVLNASPPVGLAW
jgi:hypothetical protein